jgi:hypothetical protein
MLGSATSTSLSSENAEDLSWQVEGMGRDLDGVRARYKSGEVAAFYFLSIIIFSTSSIDILLSKESTLTESE